MALTSDLASLAGFFSPKYRVKLWKCQKWHFLQSIYLKRKGEDCNPRSCCCPSQSPQLCLHHLGHYPAPSLALISLCLQGKMGLLWIAFVSPGLNSWPIFSIFFSFLQKLIWWVTWWFGVRERKGQSEKTHTCILLIFYKWPNSTALSNEHSK